MFVYIYIYIYIYIYACVCVCVWVPYHFPHPESDTRSVFKGSFTGFTQNFLSPRLVIIPRVKDQLCWNYLSIARRWIARCISFPRVLRLCGIQSAQSIIWNWAAVFMSYRNRYIICIYILKWMRYLSHSTLILNEQLIFSLFIGI